MRFFRLLKLGAAATTLVAGTLTLAPAASAATIGDATTGAHCVQQALAPGHTVPQAPHCFATWAESVAYTTGGRVQLPSTAVFKPNATDAASQQQNAQIAKAEIANNVYTLSVEYRDYNYGGQTTQFTWSADCTGAIYWWSSMPSGWNDDIGSSKAYSNCTAIHYDNSGATATYIPPGALINCSFTSCKNMGAMNDHTSSLRFVQA